MSGDYVPLVDSVYVEGDVLGSLPEGVRSMILVHLPFYDKIRFLKTSHTLANNTDSAGLRAVRGRYMEAKRQRDVSDKREINTFCWSLFKVLATAAGSVFLVGFLGLYNYHYGDMYMTELCDYPIAPTMFTYGKCALTMCGLMLILQIVVQWPLIQAAFPNCFRRPSGQEFFDLESGEVIDQPAEYPPLIDFDNQNGAHMSCLVCSVFCYIFVLWGYAMRAMWNLIHLYYYVINTESCHEGLYDAAWYFVMIPVVCYAIVCFGGCFVVCLHRSGFFN